jgi:hypothetical protein
MQIVHIAQYENSQLLSYFDLKEKYIRSFDSARKCMTQLEAACQ